MKRLSKLLLSLSVIGVLFTGCSNSSSSYESDKIESSKSVNEKMVLCDKEVVKILKNINKQILAIYTKEQYDARMFHSHLNDSLYTIADSCTDYVDIGEVIRIKDYYRQDEFYKVKN